MSNDLVLIETKIHEGDAALDRSDVARNRSVELKISAGGFYNEAKGMCEAAGLVFKTECKRVTSRSYPQVCKVMQIAKAPDPEAEAARQAEMQAGYDKRDDERIKVAVSRSRDRGIEAQNKVTAGQLDMWEEPPHRADPVKAIHTKVKNEFTTEQLIQLVNLLMEDMRVLGLGGYIK